MAEIEFAILDFLQTIHNSVLDKIMVTFTFLGEIGWFWILCGIVLLFFRKYRKNGWILLFTLLTGLLIANVLLKNLVARVRPYDVNTAVNLLISKPTDWSFPSGHTTASFGAAAALLYADKKFGIAAYIIAAIIAFSRMYLYVHYPTDILGGIAVGTLSFFIVITVYKHINWEKAASRLHNKS
jgi:undecaprenyl-diphosphatase